MTELKTLKDLNEDFRKNNDFVRMSGDEFNDYWEEKLKAEAVKWVKEKFIGEEDCQCCHNHYSMWKEFFNLTEEDLK